MTIRQCPCGKWDQLRRGVCHACYERDRRAGKIEPLTSSRPARDHIILLRVNGWRYREIARAAGIDRSQIAHIIARGRERITAKTAARLCGIDQADRTQHMRLAWDTRRRRRRGPTYEQLQREWEHRHPVRLPVPKPGAWTRAALCAQIDQEMFFPEKGGANNNATRICGRCEVRRKCLDFALENDVDHGIFGGLSANQRRKILRLRRADTGDS